MLGAGRRVAVADPESVVTRPLVLDGIATKTMESLAGGVVLAGLAIHLGATDAEIGLLAALPLFAQVAQIPALRLVFWFRDRKRLCVLSSVASRVLLFGIAAIAFLGPGPGRVGLFFVAFGVSSLLGAVGGLSWNYWMRDLIPRSELGRTVSRRLLGQGIVAVVSILGSGLLIEMLTDSGRTSLGYALLFTAGALAGFAGILAIRRMPDVPLDPQDHAPAFMFLVKDAWTDQRIRRPILFLAAFGFATTLAFPFLTVFMLVRLGLPFPAVTAFAAASLVASITFYPVWGRLTDRFGNKAVLAVAVPVFMITMLLITTVEDGSLRSLVVLGVIHVVNGATLAALELASANLVLKTAPAKNGGAFLAVASVTRSIAAGAAAVVGGALATYFAPRSLAMEFVWSAPGGTTVITPLVLEHYDFLFLTTVVLLLYALHRLALVHEEGEAPPRIVLRELQLNLQAASSMLGGRTLSNVGAHVTRHVHELRDRFR